MLQSLGAWFGKVVQNAANKKVDELAKTIVLRKAILSELVRMRFDAYVLAGKLDSDRAIGLTQRAINELLEVVDLTAVDPESASVRHQVATAVAIRSVNLNTWVELRELAKLNEFDPGQMIMVEFQDGNGSTHHAQTLIAAIQGEFLFHKPLLFPGVSRAIVAPAVKAMAEKRLATEQINGVRSRVCASQAGLNAFDGFPPNE